VAAVLVLAPSQPSWAARPVLQQAETVRRTLHTSGWQQPGLGGDGATNISKTKHIGLTRPAPALAALLPRPAWPHAALARLDKPASTALLLWPGL
jgi:hypothetical protein